MITDLQKASLWKRISAFLFDFILFAILAVGFAALLSSLLKYESHLDDLNKSYAWYEAEYDIQFQITEAEYNALSEAERLRFDEASKALNADDDVIRTYNIVLNLSLLIFTFGILVALMVLEFLVPLLLGNGQTLGKKIFGIALMRTDGVKMRNVQLFTRTVLGKFTIEIMIPAYIIIMIFFNSIGIVGITILAALLIAQLACIIATRTNSPIHDAIAGTVAVDMASQMIFNSKEDLFEYVKKIHAERAARSDY